MKEELKKQIDKHMTLQTVMYIIGTVIYIISFILMWYAPLIAETVAVSLGLGLPFLVAMVTLFYAPTDRVKAALIAFGLMGIIILALAVTGYGTAIVEMLTRLAAIVQCFACIVFVGFPTGFAFLYARKKGWTQQAEQAADKTVSDFFKQFNQPPENK